MTDAAQPFDFSKFVPGFDFLRTLTEAAAGGMTAGMPSVSNWVAPTLSVEELDKRIQELKTVQYWLEQNGHALKATIQALEVQKMTLSTLQGMNVQMEDLAQAFTRSTVSAAAAMREASSPQSAARPEAPPPAPPVAAPEPAPEPAAAPQAAAATPTMVDTLQWWNSLTQQFQHIATQAMHEAAQLRMPAEAENTRNPAAPVRSGSRQSAAKSTSESAVRKSPKAAAKKRAAPAAKRPSATRKPGPSR